MPEQNRAAITNRKANMAAESIKEDQISKPKQKKVKSRRTTSRERQVIKAIAEGKTIREAAEITGLNENYISGQMIRKPKIAEAITKLMDKAGLSDEEIVGHHRRLIEAKRKLYDPKEQTYIDVDDNQTQSAMVSLAYKVKGHLKESGDNSTQNIQINLVRFGDETAKVEGNVIDVSE